MARAHQSHNRDGLTKRWREKDGRLIHDGDCSFFDVKVCDCGLLHYVLPLAESPHWFRGEYNTHLEGIQFLKDKRPPSGESVSRGTE